MNTVHRVELEAVLHLPAGEAVVVREAVKADAYGIYVVAGAHPEADGLPQYVTEHTSQEDAYNAAVALASILGVEMENHIPMGIRFTGQQ